MTLWMESNMSSCPVRDVAMSGVSCYPIISKYFDVPEGTTGFRLTIDSSKPVQLTFMKSTWDSPYVKLFKGTSIGEIDSAFQVELANALGIYNVDQTSCVEVEVKAVEDIVTTTIKQYTTHGQLEDCLKLLKGESNVISVNS